MCSVPGYDASGLVRDLAAEENKQITSISIGKESAHILLNSDLHKPDPDYCFLSQKLSEDTIHVCVLPLSTGSAEGFNKADRDINTAVKSGRWVLKFLCFFFACALCFLYW